MASVKILTLNGDEVQLFGNKVTVAAVKVAAAKKLGAFPAEISLRCENGEELKGYDQEYVFEEPATPIVTIAMCYARVADERDEHFFAASMMAHGIAEDIEGATSTAAALPASILGESLVRCAEAGHVDVVRMLLGKGVDVNHEAVRRETALTRASVFGHGEVVRVLLDAGAPLEYQQGFLGFTPLVLASMGGHVDVVNMLLLEGANVQHDASNNHTALDHASIRGHACVVDALCAAGANVHHVAYNNNTALCFAAARGHVNTVKVLLDAGSDVHHRAYFGTALEQTVENNYHFKGNHDKIFTMLLAVGARFN